MAFFGQKQGVTNPFEKKGDFFDFEKFFLILRKVSFLSKKSLSKTTTRNQIKKKLTFFGPKARVTPFGKMRFLGLFFRHKCFSFFPQSCSTNNADLEIHDGLKYIYS